MEDKNIGIYSMRRGQFTVISSVTPGQPTTIIRILDVVWPKPPLILNVFAGVYCNDAAGFQKDVGFAFNISGNAADIWNQPNDFNALSGDFDLSIISLTSNGGRYIDFQPPRGLRITTREPLDLGLFAYDLKAGDKIFGNVQLTFQL